MTTQYPALIDGYNNIRLVRDRIDELVAADHNSLRSAVVAIEQTLGTNPQGAFSNVDARLDDAYANIVHHVGGLAPRHVDTVIESPARSGSPFALSIGTVGSQLGELLSAANTLAAEPDVEELLIHAFDAFVISGLAISQAVTGGPNADVSSGFLHLNGQLVRYSGQEITVSATPGTYYIYAQYTGGSVVVAAAALNSVPLDPLNPVVLLKRVTHAGAAWSSSIDLRRYGSFTNDKNYFTVGLAISGQDGYGADFTSLKSAVEYIKALNSYSGQTMIAPKKIILVSDLTISTTAEAQIELDIDIEIDGCGRSINYSVDTYLFLTSAENIRIHDIILDTNYSGVATSSFFVRATCGSSDGLRIDNCSVISSGSSNLSGFIRYGETAGSVSNAFFTNNSAKVDVAGIFAQGGTNALNNSSITNNRFYNSNASASSNKAIQVERECVLANNRIEGGFNTGIGVSGKCNITGNFIDGSSSAAIVAGISTVNETNSITGNTIYGISSIGIDVGDFDLGSIISGNIIDNYDILPASFIAIDAPIDGYTSVVGNTIRGHTYVAIRYADIVTDNKILGHPSITTDTGIILSSSSHTSLVSNNIIQNCALVGIDCNNTLSAVVSGNRIVGQRVAGSIAIDNIDDYNVISNNQIKFYSPSGTDGAINFSSISYEVNVSNNQIYDCDGIAINCNRALFSIINNNVLLGSATATNGIVDFDAYCNVSDNTINQYSGTQGIEVSLSEFSVISNNIIMDQAGVAIDVDNSTSVTISGNTIIDGATNSMVRAIDMDNSSHSIISNNLNKGGGLEVSDSDYVLVSGNKSKGALFTNRCNFIHINGNYIHDTTLGMQIFQTDDSSIVGNFVGTNKNTGMDNGILILSSDDCFVSGNYVVNPPVSTFTKSIEADSGSLDAIIVGNYVMWGVTSSISVSARAYISNNYIFAGIGTGSIISVGASANDSAVIGNVIYGPASNSPAISVAGDRCLIANNHIRNATTSAGIEVTSDKCSVLGNHVVISTAGVNGFELGSATNTLLCSNFADVNNSSPAQGFVLNTGSVTASGNITFDSDNITGFNISHTHNIDSDTCRVIS